MKFWASLVLHKFFYVPIFSFIYWLAIQGRLKTKDLVARFNPTLRHTCVLCQHLDEDHNHLFFQCSYSQRVLFSLLEKAGVPWNSLLTLNWDLFLVWADTDWRTNLVLNDLCKLVIDAYVYFLWKERNARVFANKFIDARSLYQVITTQIRGWLLGLPTPNSTMLRD